VLIDLDVSNRGTFYVVFFKAVASPGKDDCSVSWRCLVRAKVGRTISQRQSMCIGVHRFNETVNRRVGWMS
jgi:hypothetical protein